MPLPIPDIKHRREMLADWIGGRQGTWKPDTKQWYLDNYSKMHIHKDTRMWIEKQLSITWVDDYYIVLRHCIMKKYHNQLSQEDYYKLMAEV